MEPRPCQICGKRPARYVCQECGRNVCERCLEPYMWLCTDCCERIRPEAPTREAEEKAPFHMSFVKVFLLGFLLIFAGMVILMVTALTYGLSDSLGLIVFIGPIPIILGAGKYSFLAIILAAILTILSIAFFAILWKKINMR